MQKRGGVVQSKGGRVVVGAVIQVYLAGTSTPASIFADKAGTEPISQLVTDNEGEFAFYAPNGRYDIKTVINGRVDGQYLDEQLFDPDDVQDDSAARIDALDGEVDAISATVSGLNSTTSGLNARVESLESMAQDFDTAHGTEIVQGTWPDGTTAPVAALGESDGAAKIGHGDTTVGLTLDAIAGNGGSGTVGFIQSGTGALGRKAQDKLREIVSIADFPDLRTALTALAGASGNGYDTAPVILDLLGTTATFTGALYLPINVSLINGTVSSASRLIVRSPYAADTATRGKEAYWPYMAQRHRNLKFTCVTVIEGFIGSSWQNCEFNGLVLVNSNGMWTEYNTFIGCFFPENAAIGAGVLMDGNRDGASAYATAGSGAGTSDGSFGYNNFIGCKGDSTAPNSAVRVTGGGSWYNGVGHFTGYARLAGGGFLHVVGGTYPSKVSHCRLEFHLESFGAAANIISVDNGGMFWYNTGSIHSASPEMTFSQGASADLRTNHISVVGCALQDKAGATVTQGETFQSFIAGHLLKRLVYHKGDSLYADEVVGGTVRASTALESRVQYTGAIISRPDDTRSAASRNFAWVANVSGFGHYDLQASTARNNDPSVVVLSYTPAGLKVPTGFGCNGKEAQAAVAVNAAATDAATTQALVNQLRAALVANGICV